VSLREPQDRTEVTKDWGLARGRGRERRKDLFGLENKVSADESSRQEELA
jgi:hypothetical protein